MHLYEISTTYTNKHTQQFSASVSQQNRCTTQLLFLNMVTRYVLLLRSKFGVHAFSYTGPTAWNRLKVTIQKKHRHNQFLRILQKHSYLNSFTTVAELHYVCCSICKWTQNHCDDDDDDTVCQSISISLSTQMQCLLLFGINLVHQLQPVHSLTAFTSCLVSFT